MNKLGSSLRILAVAVAIAALVSVISFVVPERTRAQMLVGQLAVPLGYCQIAAGTLASATPLSSCSGGIPAGATTILMQAETQNIRWRDDKVAPTTSVGQLLVSGQQPFLYNGTLTNLQFIDATAGGILDVSFYRTSSP